MKVYFAPLEAEPAEMMECSCKHKFWVDPCTEENLEFSVKHGALKAVCPQCGEREEDEN